jgi:hypothetical protein
VTGPGLPDAISTILRLHTDDNGTYDATNTIAHRQSAAARNAATAATITIANAENGSTAPWTLVPDGKPIGYTLVDNTGGNESEITFDGAVPAPVDPALLHASGVTGKVELTALAGGATDTLHFYQAHGFSIAGGRKLKAELHP